MPDKTLDTKGLACPLPILKTKKALSELPKGAKLEVLATDPGSLPDFTAFCEFDRQCAARAQPAGRHLPLRHRAPRLSVGCPLRPRMTPVERLNPILREQCERNEEI